MKNQKGCAANVMGSEINIASFTAFFISTNKIVTAKHNLYRREDNSKYARFSFDLMDQVWFNKFPSYHETRPMTLIYEPVEPLPTYDFVFFEAVSPYNHPVWISPFGKSGELVHPVLFSVVATIQFNGSVDQEWLNYQKTKSPSIELTVAELNDALNVNGQSISIGKVVSIDETNNTTISYTTSTSPGSAGAPGFCGKYLCFIHSGGSEEHNYGMLIDNAVFKRAYNTYVGGIPSLI